MKTTIGTDTAFAASLLRQGQLVAIPTETVYGLAANALDAEAVLRIFEVKNRPAFDPLIVHISSMKGLYELATAVPELAIRLADSFWPGPLTMVLPRRNHIPDIVSSGMDTVALRMPAHPFALDLLAMLDFPLAAPSANPFGYISPTTALHVNDQLGGKIPYILDGGPCSIGVESTVVGVEEDRLLIYRMGGITVEQLREVCGQIEFSVANIHQMQAPGMLESHYAPRCPLELGHLAELRRLYSGSKLAVLSYRGMVATGEDVVAACVLAPGGDLREAAKNLFAAMRELDNSGADLIIAETVPEEGLGRAINDRLRRAAHRHGYDM